MTPKRGQKKYANDKQFIIELHGDQLWSWFHEHFNNHPKALTRSECRAMFRLAIEDAREVVR